MQNNPDMLEQNAQRVRIQHPKTHIRDVKVIFRKGLVGLVTVTQVLFLLLFTVQNSVRDTTYSLRFNPVYIIKFFYHSYFVNYL